MIEGWKHVRKAARVLILIDAAIAPGTLTDATRNLAGAASGFEPQDKVGIWTFPSSGGQPASHTVLRDVTEKAGSLGGTLARVKPVRGRSANRARRAISSTTRSPTSDVVPPGGSPPRRRYDRSGHGVGQPRAWRG